MEFAQRLNVLLTNLWGRKWSPRPLPPPYSELGVCMTFFRQKDTFLVQCLTSLVLLLRAVRSYFTPFPEHPALGYSVNVWVLVYMPEFKACS